MATDPNPDSGARALFIWASGFGLGALVVLFGMIFLLGIGQIGHAPTPAQTTAAAPARPSPAQPTPAARPETTGQSTMPPSTAAPPAAR